MRIDAVEIRDLLGTRYAEFKPGTLTVVSGRNGEGKSSILDALKRIFEGGHDPSVLRRGAKFGEAIVKLDSGTVIRMRVTAGGTSYEVTDKQGNEVKAPRSYIEQLGDLLAVDPARLLLAKPKDLAGILLEVMPVRFGQEELQKAVGEPVWPIARDMSLDEVEALYKQIFEARATSNKQLKEAETTINQLRQSLPENDGYDWAGRASELRQTLAEARQGREAEIAAIDRVERETIEEIKQRSQREIDQTKQEAAEARRAKDDDCRPTIEKIVEAVSTAEEKQRSHDKAEGVRKTIENFEVNARNAKKSARDFDMALNSIGELKQRKLADLPVPGIEVRDGQVYSAGVAFERINLAERIKLVFQISALRSGKLPFMVLDQAEALDRETWEAFKVGAQQSGFQVIAARVSDSPLNIEACEEVDERQLAIA